MYEPVIGLEVHVQLKTNTKAFCGCSTSFGSPPNTQTCPVCLGFPGSLPVLNEKSLELGVKVGIALNCDIQNFTKFDRKNYFYPDLPKNYQISQYELPLAIKGFLEIDLQNTPRRIGIRRVHLEEDAGKLIHEADVSLVDFNRAGMPLLEIVTEPDIYSPEAAYEYLISLKAILKYLEVSDCDMEKGSLRCDANISLRKEGAKELGTKTELKNMNSFKAVRDALSYEISRQKGLLENGKAIVQETLLWDSQNMKTYSMRSKEEAMDYRYFPEPDLPPFIISPEKVKEIDSLLPELPRAIKDRFIRDYGLNAYDAGLLTAEKAVASYFQVCLKLSGKPKIISNWITGPVMAELNSRGIDVESISSSIGPEILISLINFVETGTISNLIAKDVLGEFFDTQKKPEEIIREKNLSQISDTAELDAFAIKVINANAKSVQDYKSGKANALMFLVGRVMRLSGGKANPKVVREILEKKLQ